MKAIRGKGLENIGLDYYDEFRKILRKDKDSLVLEEECEYLVLVKEKLVFKRPLGRSIEDVVVKYSFEEFEMELDKQERLVREEMEWGFTKPT